MLTLNIIDKYDSDCECNVIYNDDDAVVNVAYFYVYKDHHGDLVFSLQQYFIDDTDLRIEAKKLVQDYCEHNLAPKISFFNTDYD